MSTLLGSFSRRLRFESLEDRKLLTASLSGMVQIGSGLGVPGVAITLTQTAGTGQPSIMAISDSAGAYSFQNLPAGTYELDESSPQELLDGADAVGTVSGSQSGQAASDQFTGIVLTTDQQGVDYNFTELGVAARYISLSMFLASTPPAAQIIRSLHTAPTLSLGGDGTDTTATFTQGGGAVSIVNTSAATVTVDGGSAISSMTITLANPLDGTAETLSADTSVLGATPRITAAYANGVLTLSGIDTAADYQAVLRTVKYNDTATTPNTTPRTITFVTTDTLANSNTATSTVSVVANTQAPLVTSVTPNLTTITAANVGSGKFAVAVTYGTTMNTAINPTLTFTPDASSTLTFASGSWNADTYTAVYNVANAGVSVSDIGIGITGAEDSAGVTQAAYTGSNNFSINTLNAVVTSVTPNLTTVTAANVGTGTFTVAVLYSATMNTTVNPTLTFTPDVSSTLTFVSGSWSGDTYTATYSVANAAVNVANIGIGVTGGEDANGNAQIAYTGSNDFSINTLAPVVSSATPSATTLTSANAGNGAFTVAVLFNEVMNTSLNPTITFTPDASSTLAFISGAWSGNTYTATYNVTNAGASIPNVAIAVSGAQDTTGDAQIAFTANDAFSIAMAAPKVTSVTPNLTTVTSANEGSGTFTVAVLYGTTMNTAVNPTIAFTPDVTSVLTFASGSWNGDTYTAVYNVGNSGANISNIGVDVSGGQDTNGNTQTAFSGSDNFSIDTVAPLVTSVTPSATTLTPSNVGTGAFTVAVLFNEAMTTTTNPTLTFTPDVSTTLTFVSGAWSGNTYTATYTVANGGLDVANVGVNVSGAQDSAGDAQIAYAGSDNFSIAMAAPKVTSVTPNLTTVTSANEGSGTFTLAVLFSTAMNTAVNPTIAFTPDASSVLTFASGSWSGDTYTAIYNVSSTAATISNISVGVSGAQDASGNVQTAYAGSDNFNINTVAPVVSSVTPSLTTVTSANEGNGAFSVAVLFDKAMNTSTNPTLTFTPDASSALTFAAGTWAGDVYTAVYNVSSTGASIANVGIGVTGAQDSSGNTQTAYAGSDNFSIDTVAPLVTSVTPSATTLTSANVGSGTFTVAVLFDKAMTTSINPAITFTPSASSALAFLSGSWSGNTYTATYNVSNAGANLANIAIGVSGGQDTAGDAQIAYAGSNNFSIAMAAPTVASVTPNLTTVTAANEGNGTFTLAVTYGTAMKTSVNPAITFAPDASSALTFVSGSWSGDTYTAVYNVSATGASIADIGVNVTGAQDSNGNPQTAYAGSDDFSIDTVAPLVTSVTPSATTLSSANVGAGKFTVAVLFNAAMKTSVNPAITFTPDASGALTFASGSWSGNTYTATYDVVNSGANVANIAIGVSGGQDSAGDAQIAYTGSDNFSIAMAAPIVTSVTPNLTTIAAANEGNGTFTVALQFSATMNTAIDPAITFTPDASSVLTFASGSWSGGNTYTAVYDVSAAGASIPSVGVNVTGAQDSNGNAQTPSAGSNDFSIDTVSPTVTSVTPNLSTITAANEGDAAFTVAVQFSTAMNTAVNPTITFTPDASSVLASPSGSWSGDTYSVTYNVGTTALKLANVGINVSGAQDAVGNTQTAFAGSNDFNLDTLDPLVTGVSASPTTIVAADVGSGSFHITVTYNGTMDQTVNPAITFTPDVSGTLTFANGTWTGNAFTAVYDVASAAATVPNVAVSVTGAQDTSGNTQIAYTGSNNFSIDTVPPTVSSVTPNLTSITATNEGSGTFTVAVAFAKAMNTSITPTIAFTPDVSTALTPAGGSWNGNTYTATYDVTTTPVSQANIAIGVTGAQDLSGNVQTPYVGSDNFSIDTTAPGSPSNAVAAASLLPLSNSVLTDQALANTANWLTAT